MTVLRLAVIFSGSAGHICGLICLTQFTAGGVPRRVPETARAPRLCTAAHTGKNSTPPFHFHSSTLPTIARQCKAAWWPASPSLLSPCRNTAPPPPWTRDDGAGGKHTHAGPPRTCPATRRPLSRHQHTTRPQECAGRLPNAAPPSLPRRHRRRRLQPSLSHRRCSRLASRGRAASRCQVRCFLLCAGRAGCACKGAARD